MTREEIWRFINGNKQILVVGTGPTMSCHGPARRELVCRGGVDFSSTVHWQTSQFLIASLTNLLRSGNQFLSRTSCLVLTIPWCPPCAMFTVCTRSFLGNTSLVPLSTTSLSAMVSSSLICAKGFRSRFFQSLCKRVESVVRKACMRDFICSSV